MLQLAADFPFQACTKVSGLSSSPAGFKMLLMVSGRHLQDCCSLHAQHVCTKHATHAPVRAGVSNCGRILRSTNFPRQAGAYVACFVIPTLWHHICVIQRRSFLSSSSGYSWGWSALQAPQTAIWLVQPNSSRLDAEDEAEQRLTVT